MDGGAESPQETRARQILIGAGLPWPKTHHEIYDLDGVFDAKVAIEYDGLQHWEDPKIRQRDIDKMYLLLAVGWIVIRVSRDLLRFRRAEYIRRVGHNRGR